MDFDALDLHPDIRRGLAEAAYITCTPVQEQVIAQASSGRDLYVQSQTGTGKTAAFLVVIFQRLLTDESLKGRKALIMVPTRELAVQVEEEAKTLGKYLPFTIGSFFGGVGYGGQQKLLRESCDILVGTPGRVLDLNMGGEMNLMEISFLVIDEADRMFDMGFYPDLRRLISVVPPPDKRQTMLFSATLNNYVKNLAWEYTREPFEIEIESEHVTVEEIDQLLYHVHSEDKMRLLLGIFEREQPESVIIFCNTKRYTEIIAQRLRRNGIKCEYISGDLPQQKRLAIIEDVKNGKNSVLVATDVAARGLDIEGLALVVNYDLPVDAENYVHRIGRTARAGKTGKAISLASEQDVYELAGIEKYIAAKIPSAVAEPSLFADDRSGGTARFDRPRRDYERHGRHGDEGRRRDERGRGGRRMPPHHAHGAHSGVHGAHGGHSADTGAPGNTAAGPRGGSQSGGTRGCGERSYGEQEQRRGAKARNEAPQSGTRNAPHGAPQGGTQPNLSQMSVEERMAYYSKKYGSKTKPKQTEEQRGGTQRQERKAVENQRKKQAMPQGAKDAGGKTPEKKGLLAKFAGLFKRKT